MDINQQKEQFSNTYVRAVASVAGYSLYKSDVDDDSIDLGIAAKGGTGPILSPRLELQLKCSSRDIIDESHVRYPLKLKNYNDLRINALVPRILVVVVVPEDITDWLQQSEEELCTGQTHLILKFPYIAFKLIQKRYRWKTYSQ